MSRKMAIEVLADSQLEMVTARPTVEDDFRLAADCIEFVRDQNKHIRDRIQGDIHPKERTKISYRLRHLAARIDEASTVSV